MKTTNGTDITATELSNQVPPKSETQVTTEIDELVQQGSFTEWSVVADVTE